jgi:subtilisin family serine protease
LYQSSKNLEIADGLQIADNHPMKTLVHFFITFSILSPAAAVEDFIIKTQAPLANETVQRWQLKKVRSNVFVIDGERLSQARQLLPIVDINPNKVLHLNNTPNDLGSTQWGIDNPSADGVDANLVPAWLSTTGSKSIVVAITDSGIDMDHPDLQDNLWENTAEMHGEAGVDDDGNGFVDDFHGWNMALNSNGLEDNKRHGTHVAGIIGARGNNGLGIVGVNWEVSLMAIPFFYTVKETKIADAIRAIDYAVENGAHVINASWGGDPDDEPPEQYSLLTEAIQRAADKDIVLVAAAGNYSSNNDKTGQIPANLDLPNIVSVGSVTGSGWASSFSNYGATTVDVFAPGSRIYSTMPGGSYDSKNGTSMAAPFVSGIVALLLSKEPQLTAQDVVARLLASCDENSKLDDKCVCQGHINADKVLHPHL